MSPADGTDSSTSLGLMAKFWEPGCVKTRLGRDLGMSRAAAIHREFFEFLTSQLVHSAVPLTNEPTPHAGDDPSSKRCPTGNLQRTVVYAPGHRGGDFLAAVATHHATWVCEPQCEGDLGKRMSHWFRTTLDSKKLGVLIGCDCPLLSTADIAESFKKLQHTKVVLGPALDGGYYLIGLAGPYQSWHDKLFSEMPWSTASVLETTLARIAEAGKSAALLEPRRDIDEFIDLQMLLEQLAASDRVLQRELGNRLNAILTSSDACDERLRPS